MRDAALRFVNAARPADRIGIVTFAALQPLSLLSQPIARYFENA